jgi:hypothetical protein
MSRSVKQNLSQDQFPDQSGPHFYANLGLHIHPVGADKRPLTRHGYLDATCDHAQIDAWIKRFDTRVQWAAATGEISGVDAIDIDRREADGHVIWGIDSLDAVGIVFSCAPTPTSHTPRGFHQWFRHPAGLFVKSGALKIAGELVAGVDIKADRSSCMLPSGPGRYWDPILGPQTALAPLPWWAIQ